MFTPDNQLGPPPSWEEDTTEFSVEVPVLVTIEAHSSADLDEIKRAAIENLAYALDGLKGFMVDATTHDCAIGYV